MATIRTESELRAIVPEPLPKLRLKILERLEKHSRRIVERASLVGLAGGGRFALLGRGAITVERDGRSLRIAGAAKGFAIGTPLGGLFLIAGMEETLRVNGRVAGTDGDDALVEVEEVFLQCPKALLRSRLWDPSTWTGDSCTVERSPFALVATEGADGRGDVSPRGDPIGSFVRRLDARTLLLPDRTGNQLADTLRNVLHRPRASLVFLVPGSRDVVRVDGRATITADAELLAPSAVKGKRPKLGIVIDVEREQTEQGGLPDLWRTDGLVDPEELPTMGEMILDQIRPNGRVLNAIGAKLVDLGSTYDKRRRLY